MKKISTLKTKTDVVFDRVFINRDINLFYLDSEQCAVYNQKTNKYELKNHENIDKVLHVQDNVFPHYSIIVKADLMEDGSIINFRVEDK